MKTISTKIQRQASKKKRCTDPQQKTAEGWTETDRRKAEALRARLLQEEKFTEKRAFRSWELMDGLNVQNVGASKAQVTSSVFTFVASRSF